VDAVELVCKVATQQRGGGADRKEGRHEPAAQDRVLCVVVKAKVGRRRRQLRVRVGATQQAGRGVLVRSVWPCAPVRTRRGATALRSAQAHGAASCSRLARGGFGLR
jgi:hypothetical protein